EEADHERSRREPVLPLEPAERLDQLSGAGQRDSEEEDEAEKPRAPQELQRQVVRLRRNRPVHAQLSVREVERTGPGAQHRVRTPRLPRLLPPIPAAAS